MILEGNNYDLDTLLVYYQDGQITASDLVSHGTDDIRESYHDFLERKDIPVEEDSAAKFLEWYLDEHDDVEEEEELEGHDIEEPEESYTSWRGNAKVMKRLAFSDAAPKVCLWRLRNPMSNDKEACAAQTGVTIGEVTEWWMTPNFMEECLGHRISVDAFDEDKIRDFLFSESVREEIVS